MRDLGSLFRSWSVAHMEMVRKPDRLSVSAARLAHAELVLTAMPRDQAAQEMGWYTGFTAALLAQAVA